MIVEHKSDLVSLLIVSIKYFEEGTPDEIFNNPKKDLTRRFIRGLKEFKAVIDSRDYDFIEFGTDLDRFIMQNDISSIVKYRLRLALEELVQQILMPVYEKPYIRINAEYSPKDGECLIDIRYKGDPFDVHDTENDLSLTMLKSTVKSMEYSYNEEEEAPNHVTVWIRKR